MTQVEKCLDDHNLNRTRSSRISPKPVMEEEAMIEVCEEKDTDFKFKVFCLLKEE